MFWPRCCVFLFSFYVLSPVLCYFVFVLCLVPGVVLFCFRSMSWPRCCVILFSFYILTPVLPVFLDLTLLITLSVFSKAIFWLVNHGKCLNIFFLRPTEKNETKTIVKIVPPRNVSVDPSNYPRWPSRLIMQLSVFQVYLKFLISNLTNINKLHLERYNIDPAWYWCIWRIAFQNYAP
jgi:hypothetical protein